MIENDYTASKVSNKWMNIYIVPSNRIRIGEIMPKIEIIVSENDMNTFHDAWKTSKQELSQTILNCVLWEKSETFFLDLMTYGLEKASEDTDAFIYSSLKGADGKHIKRPAQK